MPTYCYITDDGKTYERDFPLGKAPARIGTPDGPAKRDFAAEHASGGIGPATKGWPLECFASGVHPDQAGDLRDHLRRKGVPTEVTPEGNPVYRDANHRRRALKARGMFDRASYL
jgi:hypothetical protein